VCCCLHSSLSFLGVDDDDDFGNSNDNNDNPFGDFEANFDNDDPFHELATADRDAAVPAAAVEKDDVVNVEDKGGEEEEEEEEEEENPFGDNNGDFGAEFDVNFD